MLKTIVLSSIAVLRACLLDSALKVISVADFCWDDILLCRLSLGIWTGFLDWDYRDEGCIIKWLFKYFCATSSPEAYIVAPTASYFFLWERAAAFAALNLVQNWVLALPSFCPNFAACRAPPLLTATAVLLQEPRPSICFGALDAVELFAAEFRALRWFWLKLVFGVFLEHKAVFAGIFATVLWADKVCEDVCWLGFTLLLRWELSSTRSIGILLKFEVCLSGRYRAAERPILPAVYDWAAYWLITGLNNSYCLRELIAFCYFILVRVIFGEVVPLFWWLRPFFELHRSLEPARDRLLLKLSRFYRFGDLEVIVSLLEQLTPADASLLCLTLPMFVAHGERDESLY